MADYDPDARCPKCGNESVGTHYCAGRLAPHEYGWGQPHVVLDCPGTEHLERVCRRCSYGWLERCVVVPAMPVAPSAVG